MFVSFLVCSSSHLRNKFAYANKTYCIMDFRNYNVFDPLAHIWKEKVIELFKVRYTQVLK